MARIDTMQISEAEYTCAVGTGVKVKRLAMRGSPYTDIQVYVRRWSKTAGLLEGHQAGRQQAQY